MMLHGQAGREDTAAARSTCLLVFNAASEDVEWTIPAACPRAEWTVLLDTSKPEDRPWPVVTPTFDVPGSSFLLLRADTSDEQQCLPS